MVKIQIMKDCLREYILPLAFALLMLSIQMGVTYYFSIQTVAMLFILIVILYSDPTLRITSSLVFTILLFSGMVLLTAFRLPEAISRSSPHVIITSIGVIGYVILLLSMVSISTNRSAPLLMFLRRSSAMTISLISIIVLIAELNVFSFINREVFIRQNVYLVTNYADLAVIELDILKRKERGAELNIDLFYGEPSFLALVIFVCLVSYVIACRTQSSMEQKEKQPTSIFLIIVGLTCLVYIKAFSGFLYALFFAMIMVKDLLANRNVPRVTPQKILGLSILAMSGIILMIKTMPYFYQRIITITSSGSAQQRFGIVLELMPVDFLLGIQSAERMPSGGIHNGVIYTIMIAGIGGIAVLAYLVARVIRMSSPLGLSALSVLAMLAVFSQNGGIFSPNKLVLISLIFLPLCLWQGSAEKIIHVNIQD